MTARRLAWSMLALGVAASTIGIVLLELVPSEALEAEGDSLLLSLSFVLVTLVFGLVGAVVATRIPSNPIGWLFLGLWLINSVFELAYGYTNYSLAVDTLPASTWTAWLASWSSPLSPALIGLAFLLFPNGRLLSRRWRPLAWLCVLAIAPVVAKYALAPGPMTDFPSIINPLGVSSAGFLRDVPDGLFIGLILVSAVVTSIVRFRRSRGLERQQLKWFAFSATLIPAFIVVGGALSALFGGEGEYAAGFVFAVILCGLPVSSGIAILRYRLYDIDLVINRTLVYGGLTAALVGTYLGSVLILRLALNPLTGESDLAVATSTLAVAALFRPLRARIQAVVDRRFYRSRYDATRTLEGFAGRLRHELDLDALGGDLRRVVGDTLHPAHVSLWVRSIP